MNLTDDAALHWLERLLEAGDADRQQTVWLELSGQTASVQAAVQRLWLASQSATGMLPQPRLQVDEVRAGAQIGEHRLLSLLGSGGMAEVWLAERSDDLRREAIKFPTLQLRAHQIERFCRERSVLARIEHPHVARLYNTGLTPSGRPYIVMEYVAGAPITDAADQRRWTLRERMAAFLQLLQAVDCVHRHLVVHRDIKSSNVLVDEAGQVRLLDFGIAKLIDDHGGRESPDLTRELPCEMTLRCAAPEQVTGAAISTATDIYALGLLLFELLAGRSARADLAPTALALADWLQQGAPKMSSVVGLGVGVDGQAPEPSWTAIAQARGTDQDGLRRTLRGDLDTIVAKAVEAQPAARYASAAAFADDVSRWLALRPILARPPSLARRGGLFVRRQRVPVAVAAIGLAAATVLGVQAWQQQRAAQQSQSQAEAVDGLIASLLDGMSPDVAATRQFTAEELLDRASAYLDGAVTVKLAPAQRRLVLMRVARMYQSIGAWDKAVAAYTRSADLADADQDTLAAAQARLQVADCLLGAGKPEEAALALKRLPNAPVEGDAALDTVRLQAELLRGERQLFWGSLDDAARILQTGQSALDALQPKDLEWSARAAQDRGVVSLRLGNLKLAREQLQKALAIQQQRGSAGMVDGAVVGNDLAMVENRAGRHAEAEAMLHPLWRHFSARVGERHIYSLKVATEMVQALVRQGRFGDAQAWIDRVHAAAGDDASFAWARGLADDYAGRIAMYRGQASAVTYFEALVKDAEREGADPSIGADPRRRLLGEALLRQHRDVEALAVLRAAEANFARRYREKHPNVAVTRVLLGLALARQQQPEQATAVWRSAANALSASFDDEHPFSAAAQAYLALAEGPTRWSPQQRRAVADRLQRLLDWLPDAARLARQLRQADDKVDWQAVPVVL